MVLQYWGIIVLMASKASYFGSLAVLRSGERQGNERKQNKKGFPLSLLSQLKPQALNTPATEASTCTVYDGYVLQNIRSMDESRMEFSMVQLFVQIKTFSFLMIFVRENVGSMLAM